MSKNMQNLKNREEMRTFVNALVVDSANMYRNWLYGSEDPTDDRLADEKSAEPANWGNGDRIIHCD